MLTLDDLPFESPGPASAGETESPLPIDAAIRRLIPRDGVRPGRPSFVSEEEYLARLAALSRKCHGVRHRYEQWSAFVAQAREAFDVFRVREPRTLPDGISGGANFTFTDLRVENELEVMLFSLRSSLDVLGRIVAAHFKGRTDAKSYRGVRKLLNEVEGDSALAAEVEQAWSTWIDDMSERRDAAGHYVALSAASRVREHTAAGAEKSAVATFVAIPKEASKGSLSVWHVSLPLPTRTMGVRLDSKGESVEAHGLWDPEGRLILRRDGPLPAEDEVMDGAAYIELLGERFRAHVEHVLGLLAT